MAVNMNQRGPLKEFRSLCDILERIKDRFKKTYPYTVDDLFNAFISGEEPITDILDSKIDFITSKSSTPQYVGVSALKELLDLMKKLPADNGFSCAYEIERLTDYIETFGERHNTEAFKYQCFAEQCAITWEEQNRVRSPQRLTEICPADSVDKTQMARFLLGAQTAIDYYSLFQNDTLSNRGISIDYADFYYKAILDRLAVIRETYQDDAALSQKEKNQIRAFYYGTPNCTCHIYASESAKGVNCRSGICLNHPLVLCRIKSSTNYLDLLHISYAAFLIEMNWDARCGKNIKAALHRSNICKRADTFLDDAKNDVFFVVNDAFPKSGERITSSIDHLFRNTSPFCNTSPFVRTNDLFFSIWRWLFTNRIGRDDKDLKKVQSGLEEYFTWLDGFGGNASQWKTQMDEQRAEMQARENLDFENDRETIEHNVQELGLHIKQLKLIEQKFPECEIEWSNDVLLGEWLYDVYLKYPHNDYSGILIYWSCVVESMTRHIIFDRLYNNRGNSPSLDFQKQLEKSADGKGRDHFSCGTVPFLMGLYSPNEDKGGHVEVRINPGEERVYISRNTRLSCTNEEVRIFATKTLNCDKDSFLDLMERLQRFTKEYRNRTSHPAQINFSAAEQCRDLIFQATGIINSLIDIENGIPDKQYI